MATFKSLPDATNEIVADYLPKISEILGIKLIAEKYQLSESVIRFRTENNFYAQCGLRQMPGNCGVLILHDVYFESKDRPEIRNLIVEMAEKIAKESGYTILMSTHLENNGAPTLSVAQTSQEIQANILRERGWQVGESFKARRTGNTVRFFSKLIE